MLAAVRALWPPFLVRCLTLGLLQVQLPSFLLEPMEPTLSASPSDFRAQKLTLGEASVWVTESY